jgi:serine/threonine-protein kinase
MDQNPALYQNILQAITFPLALFLFSRIVLTEHTKKINLHPMLIYFIFVLIFLPIIWIPFSIRVFFYFLGTFFILLINYKINIYQSFWLVTLYLLMTTMLEIISLAAIQPLILGIFKLNEISEIIVAQVLIVIMIFFSSNLLKNRFNRFMKNSNLVKKYQITYPLIVLSAMVMISLLMTLVLYDVIQFRVNMLISIVFVFLITLFSVISVIIIDKYLKNKNEMENLKSNLMHFKALKETQTNNYFFEQSIEFDLMHSDIGVKIIESFTLDSLLYKSRNSSIYLLGDKEETQYTMKVIEKKEGIAYDFEGLKSILHPLIVPVSEIGEGEKYHYILKPFVKGVDLNRYVFENGPLEHPLLVKIIIQLASVFDDLHTRKEPIVYRDLKPSNIIFNSENETIRLIDIESIRKYESSKTSDTFIIGSRGYAPPEQYGFSQTLPQSDIYAMGATIYYLATGVEPDFVFISNEIHLSDLPESLKVVIKKCMSFNPKDRYGSVSEILSLI